MEGAGPGSPAESAEAEQMRNGARKWIVSAGRNWRGNSAPALLAVLCASAFCPLIAVGAGITGAAAVAGIGVLSSVGGGVLTNVITEAIDKLRPEKAGSAASSSDIEKALASEISKVLASGTAEAAALRAEIGQVLERIDADGAMLREAFDAGNDQLKVDLMEAIGLLGSDFAELRDMLSDVDAAAARIQQGLDEQQADMKVMLLQNAQQSAGIRLLREDFARSRRREQIDTTTDQRDPGERVRWKGSPYRGLLPFSQDDAEIFYGREWVTTALAVKVAGQTRNGGLIVVTGASGAGKSSLLHAGLIPALEAGLQVQGSQRWRRLVMTPTAEPLAELAIQLAAVSGGNYMTIAGELTADPAHAHLSARKAVLASESDRLVLVVDQFEQIFTLTKGPDRDRDGERRQFITALAAMATKPAGDAAEPPALVVIAVRGDFLDRCATYTELATAMQESQFVVGPMTDTDLRRAITGPADEAGLRLQPSLIDTILADVGAAGTESSAGVLPLLSQAMLLTWDNREGDELTSHGYGASGGISHAIEMSADSVYDGLDPARQVLTRQILGRMIAASPDGRYSRRPVTIAELGTLPDAGPSVVDEILEKFAAKRVGRRAVPFPARHWGGAGVPARVACRRAGRARPSAGTYLHRRRAGAARGDRGRIGVEVHRQRRAAAGDRADAARDRGVAAARLGQHVDR